MLSDITKLNIQPLIKTAKKGNKNFINGSTADKYIRKRYKVKDINYGAVQMVKIYYNEIGEQNDETTRNI